MIGSPSYAASARDDSTLTAREVKELAAKKAGKSFFSFSFLFYFFVFCLYSGEGSGSHANVIIQE